MTRVQRQTSAPLLIGTANGGKFAEFLSIAKHLSIPLVGLLDESKRLGPPPTVSEGYRTYRGNSYRKASLYATWSGRPSVGDDSGLEVPYLRNRPGVFTARYGVGRLMSELKGIRSPVPARFVCCLCYAEPQGRAVSVEAHLTGTLSTADLAYPAGELPYSAFFTPIGETRPLAELVAEGFESHRSMAFRKLISIIF